MVLRVAPSVSSRHVVAIRAAAVFFSPLASSSAVLGFAECCPHLGIDHKRACVSALGSSALAHRYTKHYLMKNVTLI